MKAVYKVVYLHITSWGGEHFYGNLRRDGETKELKHTLTASEADRLNRHDREHWEKGEEVNKFFFKNRVIRKAIKQYKEMFPGAITLVHGSFAICDPQTVLDGPREFMEAINDLVFRAEEIGGWNGDEVEMQSIADEWKDVWNAFMED